MVIRPHLGRAGSTDLVDPHYGSRSKEGGGTTEPDRRRHRQATGSVFDELVATLGGPALLTHDAQTALADWSPAGGVRVLPPSHCGGERVEPRLLNALSCRRRVPGQYGSKAAWVRSCVGEERSGGGRGNRGDAGQQARRRVRGP
jgi:hypothetical protein